MYSLIAYNGRGEPVWKLDDFSEQELRDRIGEIPDNAGASWWRIVEETATGRKHVDVGDF